MMTPDSILALLCKLNDTIDAQQAQIDQLQAALAQAQQAANHQETDHAEP